jgi:hypothetical protein
VREPWTFGYLIDVSRSPAGITLDELLNAEVPF